MITITGIGNLTKDAEMSVFENDRGVINFTIASNKKRGDKEMVTFLEAKLFGGQEYLKKILPYLLKGKKVAITGDLIQESWVSQEGQKRSKHVLYVTALELLGGGNSGNNNETSSSGKVKKISASEMAATTQTQTNQNQQTTTSSSEASTPSVEINEDDLPF